jgi:hypothetical protein
MGAKRGARMVKITGARMGAKKGRPSLGRCQMVWAMRLLSVVVKGDERQHNAGFGACIPRDNTLTPVAAILATPTCSLGARDPNSNKNSLARGIL